MYPSIRFRPRKDGKFVTPKIYCFIRLNGSLASPFSTSLDCVCKYDLKKQAFTGASEEVELLNKHLAKIRTEIRRSYEKLYQLNELCTAQMLRDFYLQEKQRATIKIPTALDNFGQYITSREEDPEQDLEEGTIEKMLIAKQHFANYLRTQNRKDIELQAIKASTGVDFFGYLQGLNNQKGEKVTHEHCFRMFQTLRKSIDFAVSKKYLIENPLYDCDIKRKKQTIKVKPLAEHEVQKLINCEGCTPTERNIIDGFVLMCYTGFRHSDYLVFCSEPQKYIFIDETGFKFIELFSFKNRKDEHQESSFVPLHEIVIEILERHNYKIPTYSDAVINEYIKRIAVRAGIKSGVNITTYTARKTCATIFGNMDGIEIKSVSKILGHKHVSTTERYYFRVQKETVKRQFLKSRK